MNPFFLQGLQHPLLTPAHLIALIALGILLGQQSRLNGNKTLSSLFPLFVFFTLAGLASTRIYHPELNLEITLLILAGGMGILTTLKLSLPRLGLFVFVLLTSLIIGLDSAPVIIPGLKASKIYSEMAGSIASISLILLAVSLIAMIINKLWQGIVLRVIGSWVSASSLMVLAFMFSLARV